jgi:hypothetical protein
MKIYRLTYKHGGKCFVQAKNLKSLPTNAKRQNTIKDVIHVDRVNASGTGYVKVKNPFK